MEELLHCQICYALFADRGHIPKTLPCGHTYCSSCIERLRTIARVMCPYCNKMHRFPVPDFVHTLPTNYYVFGLMREMELTFGASSSGTVMCVDCLRATPHADLRDCQTCHNTPSVCVNCVPKNHPDHMVLPYDAKGRRKRRLAKDVEKCKDELNSAQKALCTSKKMLKALDDDLKQLTEECPEDTKSKLLSIRVQAKSLTSALTSFNEETKTKEYRMQKHYEHRNIICDCCDAKDITGTRFMCSECEDFDICENCERQGLHSEHIMLRVVDNTTSRKTDWLVKLEKENERINKEIRRLATTSTDGKKRFVELASDATTPEDELLYMQLASETPEGLTWPEKCQLLNCYRKVAKNAVRRIRHMQKHHERERVSMLGVSYARELLTDESIGDAEFVKVSRNLGKLLANVYDTQDRFEESYGEKTRPEDFKQLAMDAFMEGLKRAKSLHPLNEDRLHLVKNFVQFAARVGATNPAHEALEEALKAAGAKKANPKEAKDEANFLLTKLRRFLTTIVHAQIHNGHDGWTDEMTSDEEDEDYDPEDDGDSDVMDQDMNE